MQPNKKIKKTMLSEKGDAMILVSILIAGIVMLVTVIAVDNLRKSTEIQSVQEKSLRSLYQAEEGVEYSLYANKEKNTGLSGEIPFAVSVWENNNKEVGNQAIQKLFQPTEGKDIVVTSESNINNQNGNRNNNQNSNKDLKRTVFANLPSEYYNQVSLWNPNNSCATGTQNCITTEKSDDIEDKRVYQVVLSNTDFQKSGWDKNNTEYRIVFRCGDSFFSKNSGSRTQTINGCEIGNLKVGVNCDYSKCPVAGCSSFMDIDFWNGTSEMSGNVILSDWFKYMDSNGNVINLKNGKMVVEFKLVNGTLEETNGLDPQNEDIKMCKEEDNGWQMFNDRTAGVASIEFRKEVTTQKYSCCGYKQLCTKYDQICSQFDPNKNCLQWTNGNCLEWRNGDCNHWCKN